MEQAKTSEIIQSGYMQKAKIDGIDASKIPPERLNDLAKAALAAMRTAYSDPEFVKGFEHWKKQQTQKGVKNG